MNIEEIHQMWEKDAPIDMTDLQSASANIPKLHAKYYRIFTEEKKKLLSAMRSYKELRHKKKEFIINPNQEDAKEHEWEIPHRKITIPQAEEYINGDQEILKYELMIGIQQEKIELLKSIIQSFNSRGYLIKNIIEDRKYLNGS